MECPAIEAQFVPGNQPRPAQGRSFPVVPGSIPWGVAPPAPGATPVPPDPNPDTRTQPRDTSPHDPGTRSRPDPNPPPPRTRPPEPDPESLRPGVAGQFRGGSQANSRSARGHGRPGPVDRSSRPCHPGRPRVSSSLQRGDPDRTPPGVRQRPVGNESPPLVTRGIKEVHAFATAEWARAPHGRPSGSSNRPMTGNAIRGWW